MPRDGSLSSERVWDPNCGVQPAPAAGPYLQMLFRALMNAHAIRVALRDIPAGGGPPVRPGT
jgi:hypothetical protein